MISDHSSAETDANRRLSLSNSGAISPQYPSPQVVTRLKAILAHVPWYTTQGMARLSVDLGVSHSTVSRIASGRRPPSHAMAQGIAQAISRRIGYRIPVEEIFSTTGSYPTGSTCQLCDCEGCLPESAFNRNGDLKRAWRNVKPGDWCRYPEDHSPTTVSSIGSNSLISQ